jgi:hypothetical protein
MNPTDSPPPERPEPLARRRMLTLAGGGVAGAALALVGGRRPARATHGPGTDTEALHVGEENAGTGSTTVLTDAIEHEEFFPHGAVLAVVNTAPTDEGAAIAIAFAGGLMGTGGIQVQDGVDSRQKGTAAVPVQRFAVFGTNEGHNESESGTAILGHCTNQDPNHRVAGVVGESVFLIERGFEGQPPSNGIGVLGRSETGIGVIGESRHHDDGAPDQPLMSGTGIVGRSGSGTGVEASSESGLGLKVLGKAGFSTSGSGLVATGQSSVMVNDPNATLLSHIMVTLTSDPGGRHVRWVSRAAGSFTLHLTDAPPNKRPETSFTYLIVEPAV